MYKFEMKFHSQNIYWKSHQIVVMQYHFTPCWDNTTHRNFKLTHYPTTCSKCKRQIDKNSTKAWFHRGKVGLWMEKGCSHCTVTVTFIIGSCPEDVQIQQICRNLCWGIKHWKVRYIRFNCCKKNQLFSQLKIYPVLFGAKNFRISCPETQIL